MNERRKIFIVSLYRYSKPGFIVLLLFLVFYGILFSKKMDSTFTPYNNMFAGPYQDNLPLWCYGVSINNKHVAITKFLYWKKDFLESSLQSFAHYKEFGHLLMDEFSAARQFPPWFKKGLIPDLSKRNLWLPWFIRYASLQTRRGDTIRIQKYHFEISAKTQVILRDSVSILRYIVE